jgi:hypothetical protein
MGSCVTLVPSTTALPSLQHLRPMWGVSVPDLEVVMKDEAEPGVTGLIAGEEPLPSGSMEVEP